MVGKQKVGYKRMLTRPLLTVEGQPVFYLTLIKTVKFNHLYLIIKHRFSDFKCETGWTSLRPTEKAESDCIKFISHRMKWWQARVLMFFDYRESEFNSKAVGSDA